MQVRHPGGLTVLLFPYVIILLLDIGATVVEAQIGYNKCMINIGVPVSLLEKPLIYVVLVI